MSDEDAWFQEQVRQAQEQQGGGGSSRDRVFVDMGELEEKQRREEERRMRMDDEARMPMPGGGGGQSVPGAAGSSPLPVTFPPRFGRRPRIHVSEALSRTRTAEFLWTWTSWKDRKNARTRNGCAGKWRGRREK